MADESADSEIVSQFLLNTCRLRPQLTEHAVQAVCSGLCHFSDETSSDGRPGTEFHTADNRKCC